MKMPLYEKVGTNRHQQLRGNIVSAAAPGSYNVDIHLEEAGNIKQISIHVSGIVGGGFTYAITGINRDLPAPNQTWTYGIYCSRLTIYLYQGDATARTYTINLDVIVE